jgi:hypothetical protein
MKLKPILFLGIAGGVVAAIRKRSDKAGELASRAYDAAPEPVKQAAGQAAEKASDLAERAKEAAPEPVKQAVDKATGAGAATGGDDDETRRYAAPAEAGSQPPAGPSGAPSDDPQATVARSVPSDPTDLATPPANLPDDVVVPDTSTDDPSVQEAEAAAAADAAAIGGDADAPRPA